MQSIELLFDAGTEAALRAEWTLLADAGLPNSARNTSPSNRPHMTVAVAEDGLEAAAEDVTAAVRELLPLPLTLGGYIVFPSSHGAVLARLIVVSGMLLELHRRVLAAVTPTANVLATARIDEWTPHSTLARRLSPEQLGSAFELLPPGDRPATGARLRLWNSQTRTVTPLAGQD